MLFLSKFKLISIFLIDSNNTGMRMLIYPFIIDLRAEMLHTIASSFISFFRSHTFIHNQIGTILLKVTHHFDGFFIQFISSDRRHSSLHIIYSDIKLNLLFFIIFCSFSSASFLFFLKLIHVNIIIDDHARIRSRLSRSFFLRRSIYIRIRNLKIFSRGLPRTICSSHFIIHTRYGRRSHSFIF